MQIILILSREHETLPKSEVIASLEAETIHFTIKDEYDGILILDIADENSDAVNTIGKRLAFVHEICKSLFGTEIENFTSDIEKYPWKDVINTDFAVRVKKINKNDFNSLNFEREIGRIIKMKLENNIKVNLEKPSTFIRIIVMDNKILVSERIIKVAKKHFYNLKPHKRPFFYPGSMSPKLARGMVNLSRVKKGSTLLDPFCGTGGILIEAGIIGASLIGVDIDEKMVEGTIQNLEFCGFKDYEVFQGDARNIDLSKKVDAIVTDPPYGISASTAGEESEKIFGEALISFERIIKDEGYVCIATPHYLEFNKLVDNTKFKIIEQYEIRMHKSLTRVISVLTKQ